LKKYPITKPKQKDNPLFNTYEQCPISRASTEIMLFRVCNGYALEFPFNNN